MQFSIRGGLTIIEKNKTKLLLPDYSINFEKKRSLSSFPNAKHSSILTSFYCINISSNYLLTTKK